VARFGRIELRLKFVFQCSTHDDFFKRFVLSEEIDSHQFATNDGLGCLIAFGSPMMPHYDFAGSRAIPYSIPDR